MKALFRALSIATLVTLFAAPAFALGANITIYDGNSDGKLWHGASEDQEVEPGMVHGQAWDLEGFFFDQTNALSVVGGFDFKDGYDGYGSGDIFISTADLIQGVDYGDIHRSSPGEGNHPNAGYAYNYVFDLDFTSKLYSVYEIDATTLLQTAKYKQNEGSSPWQYDVSDNPGDVALFSGLSFAFFEGLTDLQTGFLGGDHYLLSGFDLSFLGHGTDFYAHFTMGCGNDNLMGQGTVVPEPSTFMLLGLGGGLIWLTRRRQMKK